MTDDNEKTIDTDNDRVTKLKEKINERWRLNLFKICVVLAAIGSITEVVIYLIDSNTKTLFLPNLLYQFRFIYIPSFMNLIVILLTYHYIKAPKLSDTAKNIWSCVLIYFLCANTQFIHYVYGPLLMLPIISIFVSIMFGNRKLTRGITIASLISLTAASIVSSQELRKGDPQLLIDSALAGLVIIVAQIGASLMISYVNEQFDYIAKSNMREKKLIEELHLDSLMGIFNRMALNEKTEECINLGLTDDNCHMLLLDVDNFKKINDTYGHLNGDEVLIKLSDTIRQFTGRNVTAYRYGGEEIILIMQHSSFESAYEFSEKLRLAFSSLRFDFAPNEIVTFSGGLATLLEHETAGDFISLADQALYQAKRLGKNRIIKYTEL